MVKTLMRHGVKATTVAGDSVDESALRTLVQKAMGDDGQFVLVNFCASRWGRRAGDIGRCWRPMTRNRIVR
jgi:hypothetical protein